MAAMTSIEFCAGAGGQALGLSQAGFRHRLLVDNDADCCASLTANRPGWNVQHADMKTFDATAFKGIDLMAGGLPCPPFSIAGKQLGAEDERDLFPAALRIVKETAPKFVLIENVKGFLSPKFVDFRARLKKSFDALGYEVDWRLYNASDFGVSQLRPRVTIVAARRDYWANFAFPTPKPRRVVPVGRLLHDLMAAEGWAGADAWAANADSIAPTIVGGSKKHGGPDLGPTRARAAWRVMGVNGSSIADVAPDRDFEGLPRLTSRMVARVQGFPDDWIFTGRKTTAYRQIGNAFPPPVAREIGRQIKAAIAQTEMAEVRRESIAAE